MTLRLLTILSAAALPAWPLAAQETFSPVAILEVEGVHRLGAALADLDGDGVDDLVLSRNGTFAWRPGRAADGARTFGDERSLGAAVHPSCEHSGPPVLADIDGDGDPDLISLDSPWAERERAVWFRNDGSGRFAPAAVLADPAGAPLRWEGQASGIACADWDGDGHLDLLVAQPEVLYFRGLEGRFAQVPSALGVRSAGALLVCDRDGDGSPELITVEDGGLVARRRGGLGEAEGLGALPNDPAQAQVSATDWDADGRLDLVVSCALAGAPPVDAGTEADPLVEAARRVLAVVDAERSRLDRIAPANFDSATLERRAARRAELERWAAGPRAVLAARSTETGARIAPRVQVSVWIRR
jgi:hypothetical protein